MNKVETRSTLKAMMLLALVGVGTLLNGCAAGGAPAGLTSSASSIGSIGANTSGTTLGTAFFQVPPSSAPTSSTWRATGGNAIDRAIGFGN